MKKRFFLAPLFFILAGCSSSKDLGSTDVSTSCSDTGTCKFAATMLKDQFERSHVLVNVDSQTDELRFWWRKIINDQGRIISGQAGNNVDVRIFSSPSTGPGSDDGSALYFFGRDGRSVHNIYLVSQTFDLRKAEEVSINFKYLPIGLEDGEYLRLEVCRATPEECGVGEILNVSGLNSANWQVLFEADNSLGLDLDGKNHTSEDWAPQQVKIDINSDDLRTFTFRFHARMNEGFQRNNESQPMDDGAGLDEISATAFRTISKEPQPDPEPIPGVVNPFSGESIFDENDPRLF